MGDWIIRQGNGIHLPQIDWWLDPQRPADHALITHAHFDHLSKSREVICTEATAHFMRRRMPSRRRDERILPFGQAEQIAPGCTATLLPAGHILGSAMVLLNHVELGSLLYTGDFKLRKGLVAEACATPRADTLIMESTFGKPRYCMPPAEDVRRDVIAFCERCLAANETPVLMAYSLGKAQEIIATLSGLKAPLMVHPSIEEMNRLHADLGVVLPTCVPFDEGTLAGHVLLCPPMARKSSFMKKVPAPRLALLSGWALDRSTIYRQQCDAAFPLSDHADFADLLGFASLVAPRRILTVHGFANEFAATLRERGFDALALGQPNQLDLGL